MWPDVFQTIPTCNDSYFIFCTQGERGETQASLLSVYYVSGSYVMSRESETRQLQVAISLEALSFDLYCYFSRC